MLSDIVINAKNYVKNLLIKKWITEDNWYYYHNWNHTKTVFEEVIKLWDQEMLNEEYKEILQLAALFHDVWFIEQYDNNEYIWANIAEEWLKKHNYPKDKIDIVKQTILATIVWYKPKNLLEQIIKDADLYNLWSNSFIDCWNKLRKELEEIKWIKFSDEDRKKYSSNFISNFEFYSNSWKKLRKKYLEKNKQKMLENNN